ncbi:MAG: hypothetical protein JRN21_09660 [Nitrososphaerota archaeon]|nr:hypothetical protein [Nitrososphaerota archaeon]
MEDTSFDDAALRNMADVKLGYRLLRKSMKAVNSAKRKNAQHQHAPESKQANGGIAETIVKDPASFLELIGGEAE